MENKKGFTLIELLAVIVILAIIALISTPVIIGVIENSRKNAFINSGYGILDAAKLAVIDNTYLHNKKIDVTGGQISYGGEKPLKGYVIVQNEGATSIKIKNKDYCAFKDFTEEKIKIVDIQECDVIEVDTAHKSMYNWNINLLTGYAQKDSINLMQQMGITTVYQDFTLDETEEMKQLVDTLTQARFEVYSLTGDPSWWNRLDKVKGHIDGVKRYNDGVNEDKKIRGILFDIEFYLDTAWNSDRNTVLSTYVDTIRSATAYAHQFGLKLVVALPVWLDSYETELEEIIKMTDMVSMMNYSKTNGITAIKKEVELAKKNNKPIEHIANFGYAEDEEDKDTTFFEEGLIAADTQWQAIKSSSNYENLTNSYHSLRSLLYLEKNYEQIDLKILKSSGSPTSTEMSIKVNGHIEFHTSKENGKLSFVVPKGSNYEITGVAYMIESKSAPSITPIGKSHSITVGTKKDKHSSELYFYIWNSTTNKYDRLNHTELVFTSVETGKTYTKTTHETEGYIAFNSLRYYDHYVVTTKDNKSYTVNVMSENSGQNTIYHTPDRGDYVIEDIYLKEI